MKTQKTGTEIHLPLEFLSEGKALIILIRYIRKMGLLSSHSFGQEGGVHHMPQTVPEGFPGIPHWFLLPHCREQNGDKPKREEERQQVYALSVLISLCRVMSEVMSDEFAMKFFSIDKYTCWPWQTVKKTKESKGMHKPHTE